jgi:hypothetical protein
MRAPSLLGSSRNRCRLEASRCVDAARGSNQCNLGATRQDMRGPHSTRAPRGLTRVSPALHPAFPDDVIVRRPKQGIASRPLTISPPQEAVGQSPADTPKPWPLARSFRHYFRGATSRTVWGLDRREGVPLPRNALEPLGTKALKRSPDRAPVIWLGTSPFNRGCTFRRAAHFELMVVQSLRYSKRWLPTCRVARRLQ